MMNAATLGFLQGYMLKTADTEPLAVNSVARAQHAQDDAEQAYQQAQFSWKMNPVNNMPSERARMNSFGDAFENARMAKEFPENKHWTQLSNEYLLNSMKPTLTPKQQQALFFSDKKGLGYDEVSEQGVRHFDTRADARKTREAEQRFLASSKPPVEPLLLAPPSKSNAASSSLPMVPKRDPAVAAPAVAAPAVPQKPRGPALMDALRAFRQGTGMTQPGGKVTADKPVKGPSYSEAFRQTYGK